jgi:hypothetical protein
MPYCVWVTRAPSYAVAHQGALTGALIRDPVDDMLDMLNATRRAEDASYWLDHPTGKDPWCAVFLHPNQGPLHHVEFSTSFTHPSFPRNMADMFDLALKLGRSLGACVFEESRGQEVSADNVDDLLDPKGEFAQGLFRFWKAGRQRLLVENHAPLEFPLGAIDAMSDYFFFEIPTTNTAPYKTLAASTPNHLIAHVLANSIVLEDRASGQGVVRIGRFDRGYYVRPYWSDLPFAILAREVLAAVDRISAAVNAPARYYDHELGPELRARIAEASRRHGAEYAEKMGLLVPSTT